MKSGATLALAVALGAAGVCAYWYVSRNPEAIQAGGAVEPGPTLSEPEWAVDDPPFLAGTNDTPALPPPPAQKSPARPNTPLGHAVAQQSPSARTEALQRIAQQADVTELRALVAEARTLSVAADRREALDILLLRWFEQDPESAPRQLIEQTLNEPAGVARTEHLTSIGAAWAQVSAES